MLLKVLAFVLILAGVFVVFGARWLVEKYNLDRDVKCDFEGEISEDELKQYKRNKAVVNLKMLGMLLALPGFILVILLFK